MGKTCKQCRYFDYSHEICRHPCGSKSYEDVGEEDTCEQFVNKQKRMNSEEVLHGLESIRNDYGCQAEIYEQRIIDDTIKLIKDQERTITNQQHVIKCLEYDISKLPKEQEAKKVNISQTHCGMKYGLCPQCGKQIDTLVNPNYCGCCGQKVKWK